jgi:hypothetical protein
LFFKNLDDSVCLITVSRGYRLVRSAQGGDEACMLVQSQSVSMHAGIHLFRGGEIAFERGLPIILFSMLSRPFMQLYSIRLVSLHFVQSLRAQQASEVLYVGSKETEI